ncbi:hypothetical protein B296_00010603 [Ensete ventricosum]|uniref:Uncharacterized protein n=1 Tax=Ensete ventricosum TaxID=4639 RepID=A0A426YUV0_ENSVE|nr:hypothetical protein B296_00010603 [Ensete ventricosum]
MAMADERGVSLSTRTRPGEVQTLMPAVPLRGSFFTPVSGVSTAYTPHSSLIHPPSELQWKSTKQSLGISGGYVVTFVTSFHGDARGSTQECVGYHGGLTLLHRRPLENMWTDT